jgi:hypothetical protein
MSCSIQSLLWLSSLLLAFCSCTASAAAPKTSKRGLAFSAAETPGDLVNANQTKSQISWQYDWGTTPPNYLAVSNIEYVPMQWGAANIEGFADAVKRQGSKTILVGLFSFCRFRNNLT